MNRFIALNVMLAIVLLPLDSIPGIFPSVYRPISLIFLIVIFPLVLTMKLSKINNAKKSNLILLIFYLFTISTSYIYSYYHYNDLSGFFDYSLTLTFGIISFYTFDYYFSMKRNSFTSNEDYIYWVFEIIGRVYIFILVYAIYEVLVMLGLFPAGLKELVLKFLTGRGGARVQLLSGETSWATMHLIFITPIYYYLMKRDNRYKKYFYLSISILLLMFSLQGYIIVISGALLFLILERRFKNLFMYLIYFALLLIGVYIVWKVLSNVFTGVYYITRIDKFFNVQKLSELLYLDGSVFIRVVFPYIGLMIFENNVLLGVGGGNYRFELGNYILDYFPLGFQYTEVQAAVYGNEGNPKNMYSRLLSETGLLGTTLFIWFLYSLYKKIKLEKYLFNNTVKMFFILVIAMYVQFDSFAFIQMWLAFSIVNNLKK